MGVLLQLIKQHGWWKGRAENFGDFLHQERINTSAARQYMRVAEKLYFDLGLRISNSKRCRIEYMSTLEKACGIINEDNKERNYLHAINPGSA